MNVLTMLRIASIEEPATNILSTYCTACKIFENHKSDSFETIRQAYLECIMLMAEPESESMAKFKHAIELRLKLLEAVESFMANLTLDPTINITTLMDQLESEL